MGEAPAFGNREDFFQYFRNFPIRMWNGKAHPNIYEAVTLFLESLDVKAKERYREKLSCVGLAIQDDPYLPTNDARFVNDMATWPRIEFGHIFAYFIGKTVQNSITLDVNVKGFIATAYSCSLALAMASCKLT